MDQKNIIADNDTSIFDWISRSVSNDAVHEKKNSFDTTNHHCPLNSGCVIVRGKHPPTKAASRLQTLPRENEHWTKKEEIKITRKKNKNRTSPGP